MRILNFKMPKANSLKPPHHQAWSNENMREAVGQNFSHVGYAGQDRKTKNFTCQICEN
jgi:hypothetical protein